MLSVREEVQPGLQPEDALEDTHGREAFLMLVPWLPQTLQPEVKPARTLADPPFRGLVERRGCGSFYWRL